MIDEDYTGKKIKIFAVGADYDVYEDTKYFSEGIIYNFLILEEQNGQWRVNTLMQIADPSLLKMKGYHFQSDYNITENIMEARENGYLVNGKGKVFSDINEKEIDGSLVDESEDPPRIRICVLAPGSPLSPVTFTPAILPCIRSWAFTTTPLFLESGFFP